MTDFIQKHDTFRAGYFGKIPCRGDFVSNRLPREFVEPWDYWLQNAIAVSRTHLSETWLDTYLTSPIWRFFLSPGICGKKSWLGALMPSVDKVGRYFPLTIALPLPADSNPFHLLNSASHWFIDMEKLILSALDDEHFNLSDFDQSVEDMGKHYAAIPLNSVDPQHSDSRLTATDRWHIPLNNSDDIMESYPALLWHLIQRRFSTYSLWWTNGSEQVSAGLSVSDGLPPGESFSALLDGKWENCAWEDWPMPPVGPDKSETPPDILQSMSSPDEEMDIEDGATKFQWSSASTTDVGCIRTINEDAFLESPEKGCWVVADGMGGHDAGDFASLMIVNNLRNIEEPGGLVSFVEDVTLRLQSVNELLLKESFSRENGTIGSTVAILLAFGVRAAVLWAGDSRVYLHRQGETLQISRDHSLINERMDQPMHGGEIAADKVNPNVITRAVGADNRLELDVEYVELQEGDTFLLCSDGLNKEVSDEEISDILNSGDCDEITKSLLDLALKRGARDNVTVITSKVMSGKEREADMCEGLEGAK